MSLTEEQLARWNEARALKGDPPLALWLANELLLRLDEQTRQELMERVIR